jgi:hypothetical protein
MPRIMKLLIVADCAIESKECRDAIVRRAAAGPVHVTLVAPASLEVDAPAACRTATSERLERAVQQLRDAGVPVEGVVGGDPDAMGELARRWDPHRFDEVVVSCHPWLSCRRDVAEAEAGSAGA